MFYDNLKAACNRKGITVTDLLKMTGYSTSLTGRFKAGGMPNLRIAIDLANYLGITLDEMCFGFEHFQKHAPNPLTSEQRDWLDLLDRIPSDRRQLCLDFLATHAAVFAASSKMA